MPAESTSKDKKDGVSMSVRLTGSPDKVKAGMSDLSGSGAGQAAAAVPASSPLIKEALIEPTNSIRAVRTSPKKDSINREYKNYMDFHCPTNRADIERQIADELGGHRWHVGVLNDEGVKITGFNLNIAEKPKPVYEDAATTQFPGWPQLPGMGQLPMNAPGMLPGIPGSPLQTDWPPRTEPQGEADESVEEEEEVDPLDQVLNQLMASKGRELKMAEIERLMSGGKKKQDDEDAMAAALEKLGNQFGGIVEEVRKSTEDQIKAIRDELKEQKHDRELQDERTRHETEITKLEQRIEQLMTRDSKGDVLEMIRAMKDDDKLFKVLLEQNRSSTESFREIMGMVTSQKPENTLDTVNSVVGAMSNMANMMGWSRGGDEDLPFESRLLKTINEVTPEVLKTWREEKTKGRELTEEVLKEKVDETVEKLLPALRDEVRSSINDQAKTILGKVPGGAAPALPSGKPTEASEGKPAENVKPKIDPSKLDELLDTKQEIAGRVTQALVIMARELLVRPADAQWIDFVFDNFPPDLIKTLATAGSPLAFIAAIEPYVPDELLARVIAILKKDKEAVEWLKDQAQIFRDGYFEGEGGEDSPSAPATPPSAPATPPSAPATPPSAPATPPAGVPGEGMVFDPEEQESVVYDVPEGVADITPVADPTVPGPLGGLNTETTPDNVAPGPLGGLDASQAAPETEEPAAPAKPPAASKKKAAATKKASKKNVASKKKAVRKKATKKKATKKSS